MPPKKPVIVTVPPMNYLAVRGTGDPNTPDGAYKQAVGLLYSVAYTIKMSPKAGRQIAGHFDYVVPPLEGFWMQTGTDSIDYSRKEDFQWISVIRLPDHVTEADLAWAVEEASRKKKTDHSAVGLLTVDEGLCVQCMHIGPYDDEPETVQRMHAFLEEQGYCPDLSAHRLHHEIYLSDVRKTVPEKLKTVIRHPIRKDESK